MSAQICSLSENVVWDWWEMIPGAFHALLLPAAADTTLSVRETAMASNPLKVDSDRVAPRFEVRLA